MLSNWQDLFHLPAELRSDHRCHLIGIGGTGLAPIAKVLLELGFQVSGSDHQPSTRTEALVAIGAHIDIGHSAGNLDATNTPQRPDLVLISSAIPESNPELEAARQAGIPVVKRSDLLGPLTADRAVIAVAGTHGKTTTTGMIAHLLAGTGLEPGYIIGSEVPGLGFSAAGSSPLFVIEADEYDYAFLGLRPEIVVLTSLDWDHPDCFPTRDSYEDVYRQFLQKRRPDGHVIYCSDDVRIRMMNGAAGAKPSWHSYGSRTGADWQLGNIEIKPEGTAYELTTPTGEHHSVHLAIPGLHIALNSAGALIAARYAGAPLEVTIPLIRSYLGAGRRFEIKGEAGGILVIDDYAHHPTEIRTTLAATRAAYPEREIWAIYQPHTYSRTRTFLGDFEGVFAPADHLIVSDIYAAREALDPDITAEQVIAASRHEHAHAIPDLAEIQDFLLENVRTKSLVIILSAGTATSLGPSFLKALRATRVTSIP